MLRVGHTIRMLSTPILPNLHQVVTMVCTSDPLWASGSSPAHPAVSPPSRRRSGLREARAHRQLSERIRSELAHDGHHELGRVRVNCDGHWVELSGKVSSFYLKQRAQEAVRRVAPGRQVFNEVQVSGSMLRKAR